MPECAAVHDRARPGEIRYGMDDAGHAGYATQNPLARCSADFPAADFAAADSNIPSIHPSINPSDPIRPAHTQFGAATIEEQLSMLVTKVLQSDCVDHSLALGYMLALDTKSAFQVYRQQVPDWLSDFVRGDWSSFCHCVIESISNRHAYFAY